MFVAGDLANKRQRYSMGGLLEHMAAGPRMRAEMIAWRLTLAYAELNSTVRAHRAPHVRWFYPRIRGGTPTTFTRRDVCLIREWMGADEVALANWHLQYVAGEHGCV